FAKMEVLEQREINPFCRRAIDCATTAGVNIIPRNSSASRIKLEAGSVEILLERVGRVRIGIAQGVRPIAGNYRRDVAKSGGVIIRAQGRKRQPALQSD